MRVSHRLLAVLVATALAACTDRITQNPIVLPAPTNLSSISLNGAVSLSWDDNAYLSNTSAFDHYNVFSTGYNLDSNLCGTAFSLEGTTVSPAFLVGSLTNGVPKCFAVSAVSISKDESPWSALRYDTPRPDARDVVVRTAAAVPSQSGFQFWLDANGNGRVDAGELGVVGASTITTMDFTLVPGSNGTIFIKPGPRAKVQAFSPIDDLTDFDIAPATGYDSVNVLALPRTGMVFAINPGDGFFRYGAIHVAAAGPDYIVFDWSYQTDPGNPELIRVGATAGGSR